MAGLVTRDEGIPIAVDVGDGNRDDPTGSRDALWSQGRALSSELLSQRLFVADAKRLLHDTVTDRDDVPIRCVSRRPNTVGGEQTTRRAAAPANAWTAVGFSPIGPAPPPIRSGKRRGGEGTATCG
ncbi:MAG: hypothetical protein M0Z53_12080 [Thermaerobacter sp.]|nr:hypothetical protein [Thermaerobacter sp.]